MTVAKPTKETTYEQKRNKNLTGPPGQRIFPITFQGSAHFKGLFNRWMHEIIVNHCGKCSIWSAWLENGNKGCIWQHNHQLLQRFRFFSSLLDVAQCFILPSTCWQFPISWFVSQIIHNFLHSITISPWVCPQSADFPSLPPTKWLYFTGNVFICHATPFPRKEVLVASKPDAIITPVAVKSLDRFLGKIWKFFTSDQSGQRTVLREFWVWGGNISLHCGGEIAAIRCKNAIESSE